MPHLPGHNRPFTSFLTQGMRNTNRNIGNFNNPGGGGFQNQYKTPPIFNPPLRPKPLYPEKPSIGMIPPHGRPPEDELPQGWEWQLVSGNWEPVNIAGESFPPSPGTGTTLTPPNYLQTPTNPHPGGNVTGWTPPSMGEMWDMKEMTQGGFDVNNDGVINAQDAAMASQMSPADWAHSTGAEGFTWENYLDLMYQGGVEAGNWADFEGNPWYSSGLEWYESLADTGLEGYQELLQRQFQDGGIQGPTGGEEFSFGGSDEGIVSWTVENPSYGWDFAGGTWYNPEYSAESQQGFLDNLINYITPQQLAPQQFAGGGGQGGQAAKQLYYPGTSGGFAGVGSGIGGGKSLQELLGGM